ncbi:hypothetical protein AALO_G00021280 [Alosa alosa]|uniref:Uncharacterized protein n=1 Tax=Alosa alosa TaxID=278164 RepID=A0AAV6H9X3_9TELE|nr:hypothetical protein AALO_G00021280 [Alosa alosa]
MAALLSFRVSPDLCIAFTEWNIALDWTLYLYCYIVCVRRPSTETGSVVTQVLDTAPSVVMMVMHGSRTAGVAVLPRRGLWVARLAHFLVFNATKEARGNQHSSKA